MENYSMLANYHKQCSNKAHHSQILAQSTAGTGFSDLKMIPKPKMVICSSREPLLEAILFFIYSASRVYF